jgi:hypothetical protein
MCPSKKLIRTHLLRVEFTTGCSPRWRWATAERWRSGMTAGCILHSLHPRPQRRGVCPQHHELAAAPCLRSPPLRCSIRGVRRPLLPCGRCDPHRGSRCPWEDSTSRVGSVWSGCLDGSCMRFLQVHMEKLCTPHPQSKILRLSHGPKSHSNQRELAEKNIA